MAADLEAKPNEFDIETLSGVLDTLQGMPLFKKYEPDAKTSKQALLYDFLGRPTLEYSPTCNKPIADAIDQLELMQELNSFEQDTTGTTTLVLALAAELFALGVIWQISSTICFSSAKCRKKCICHRQKKCCGMKLCCCCFCRCKKDNCFKASRIMHGAVITVFSILMMVF